MKDPISSLVHRYLDGMLTESEEAELNSWVKLAPENASELADLVLFHDRLQGVLKSRCSVANVGNQFHTPHRSRSWLSFVRLPFGRFTGFLSGLSAFIVFLLAVIWWDGAKRVSAATELNRLIESVATRDRSYFIRNLDQLPEQTGDRRPPIDGAELHVRYPDCYVLIRRFSSGEQFVTGSDGVQSWSIPPNGPVRVSADLLRFQGPIPGNQYGIPFVNLRSDLVQLRDAYVVSPLGVNPAGHRGLLAVKKSTDYRGPNRVELWYDSSSGVIHRMVFSGLPKARGGPDRVSVELLEQKELGVDFFRRESHHAANRRILEDD
jgi:hypothetical protein